MYVSDRLEVLVPNPEEKAYKIDTFRVDEETLPDYRVYRQWIQISGGREVSVEHSAS